MVTTTHLASQFLRGLILACSFAAATAHAQDAEETMSDFIPYPVHTHRLDNGLSVIVVPMPSNGLATYWSIVRTGSRDEYEPGRSGFAHFFEHMMFRGTETYPADVYLRTLTELGADGNAYTSDDLTAYHISMTAEDLEQVMQLESDRFMNLAYSEDDFKTEAGAVYGEYRKNRTNPLFVLYEAMMAAAFTEHTYGHTTIGYERDIAAMPTMYDYSRSFFDRYYRPENTVLFVAGDVEPQAVAALAETYYADWEPGYVAAAIEAEPEQLEERRIDVGYDGQSLPILWVAYKLDAFDPSNIDRVAADLLGSLAFGSTSEAYRRLVLDEQVVEFLQAGSNLNRDPTLFDIYTRIKDPDRVDYVLGIIDETVSAYLAEPPDAERVADLKSRIRYDFLMGLETPDAVASGLARYVAVGGGLEGVRDLYRAYEQVQPEDIQRAAKRYLDRSRRTVGVLRAEQ